MQEGAPDTLIAPFRYYKPEMVVDACAVKLAFQKDAGKGDRFAVYFGHHHVCARVVVAGGVVCVGDCFEGMQVMSEAVGDFAFGIDLEDGRIVLVALKLAEDQAGYGRRVG